MKCFCDTLYAEMLAVNDGSSPALEENDESEAEEENVPDIRWHNANQLHSICPVPPEIHGNILKLASGWPKNMNGKLRNKLHPK